MIDSEIRPIYDYIVVQRLEEKEKKTESGIILTDKNQGRVSRGRVTSVGRGHRNQDGSVTPLLVEEGNEILFKRYGVTELEDDLVMMQEKDVLGILEDN